MVPFPAPPPSRKSTHAGEGWKSQVGASSGCFDALKHPELMPLWRVSAITQVKSAAHFSPVTDQYSRVMVDRKGVARAPILPNSRGGVP